MSSSSLYQASRCQAFEQGKYKLDERKTANEAVNGEQSSSESAGLATVSRTSGSGYSSEVNFKKVVSYLDINLAKNISFQDRSTGNGTDMLSSGRSSELSSLISRPGDRTSFPSSKQPGSNNDITGNKKSPKKQTGANANGITTRSATLPNLRARHSFAKENMERIASKGDDDPLESSRKRKRTGKLSLAPAHASLVTRKVGKGKGKGKVSERNAHKAQTSKLEACDGEEDFHEPECSTSTLREGSSSNVHVIRPIFSNDSSKFPSQANKKGKQLMFSL